MPDNPDRAGYDRLLRDALVALSLPADEQARMNGPGCLACDLMEDFDHARRAYLDCYSGELSAQQLGLLATIDAVMSDMTVLDYECFNPEVVRRPIWEKMRILAQEALAAFKWPDATLTPYVETKPGVWQRPVGASLSQFVILTARAHQDTQERAKRLHDDR